MNKKKQKNVMAKKQENVFKELKGAFKRGQGLSKPTLTKDCNINIEQKENSEAVRVRKKRTSRISTYIHPEISDMIDEIILKLKKRKGKKPKIAEVLEMAIKDLYKTL